ncbi:sugar ABC transporter [Kluyvera georgiana]|uniref:sugar ABC transporter n=1 Tax=Kluyvera georgiana TaxID=73098 RepID=UPI003D97E428
MFYIVECSYSDPQSEAEWNAFYSQIKLPALISVNGFTTSQRFRAVTLGCPVYLAIHTVKNAEVLNSEDYRLKGGGNFSRWQDFITDWHRNLYTCRYPAPVISTEEILLLSAQPIAYLTTQLGYPVWEMQAAGLDKSPEHRLAYVVPHNMAALFMNLPGVDLYEAMTPQLQKSVKILKNGHH